MEKMKVYYGTEPTAEGMPTLVKDLGEFHTASAIYLHGLDIFTPEAGVGYIGFDACSDADCGIIYLKDVSIREYSARDLSVAALHGSQTVNVGSKATFGVEVVNEGSAPVSDYKVQLIDADDNMLAEVAGTEAIAARDTLIVPVDWTPAAEGTMDLRGKVVLDGDTYPKDNVSASPMKVSVAAASDAKWLTVTKNDAYYDEASAGWMNVGWNYPFYLSKHYSQTQTIYLDKEIQLKNIKLTGVQFHYNGTAGMAGKSYSTPVTIAIMPCDETYFQPDDAWNIHFLDGNWTTVYDGDVTVEGNEVNAAVTLMFNTPYEYKGGNIVVKYDKTFTDDVLTDETTPCWYYTLNWVSGADNEYRTASYASDFNDAPELEKTGSMYFSPYTVFAYVDINSGVEGVMTTGKQAWQVWQSGTVLQASRVFTKMELIAQNGAVVARGSNVNHLNVNGLKGAYILRLTSAQGTSQVAKVILK